MRGGRGEVLDCLEREGVSRKRRGLDGKRGEGGGVRKG